MPESLADWVTQQAERRPEAVAVVGEGEVWTYDQVETFAGRLAASLAREGCAPGDRVCLLMPKTPVAIAALVGIYKAGAIYVPLDPGDPPARLARMIGLAGPRFVLAGGVTADRLDEVLAGGRQRAGLGVVWLGAEAGAPPREAVRLTRGDVEHAPMAAPRRGDRRDPAHILFTSGSTGAPKGVVITHDNVVRFVEWGVRYFGLGPTDRFSSHPPLHFDLSVFDIFGSFASGGQLHLVPPRLHLSPRHLATFIREAELTQWFSVPSVLSYMAKFGVVGQDDFPALRRLLWCGEVFPTPALAEWMAKLPHVSFTNLYGPTEATIASSYYTLPARPEAEQAPVPIGTACDGEELLVLDAQMRALPDDVVGELHIGGCGLSPGYWGDPERTREAFRVDPRTPDPRARLYRTGDLAWRSADGLYHFAGRADNQVKSRGHRIELGEVEAGLLGVGELHESAVVALPTGDFEGTILCCAYVPVPGRPIEPAGLRRSLEQVLPGHMIPARWIAFDRLPRNGNGKIDRVFLKDLFARHESAATRHV